MRRLLTHPVVRTHVSQGWRFLVTGSLGAVVDLGTLTLVVEGMNPPLPIAFTLSTITALTIVFLLNKHWTFSHRAGGALSQCLKFLLVYGTGFVLNVGIATFLALALHLWYLLSKALAIGVVMFWNYALLHSFVFRVRRGQTPAHDWVVRES